MKPLGNPLFIRSDHTSLHPWLEFYANQEITKAVDALPDETFGTRTDEELAAEITQALSVTPLAVEWDRMEREVTEHTVREHDPFGRGLIQRKGLRGIRKYPFTGPSGLWQLLPSTYGTNVPYGQVSGQHLIVGVEMTEQEAERAPAFLDEQVASIKLFLERQRADIATFNVSLPNRIRPRVQERRARRTKAAELLKRL